MIMYPRMLSLLLTSISCASFVSAVRFDFNGIPVWAPQNHSAQAIFLRSPEFSINPGAVSASLFITAKISPLLKPQHEGDDANDYGAPRGAAVVQGVLSCSYKVWVNGILLGVGPGHAFPAYAQAVNTIDIGAALRPTGSNVIAIASFFSNASAVFNISDANPRVQADVRVTDGSGVVTTVTATGAAWSTLDASAYMSPTGETEAGTNWYSMPQEFLQRQLYPVGWTDTGFNATPQWRAAQRAPDFALPYLEEDTAAVALTRTACSVTLISSAIKCGAAPEAAPLELVCSLDGSSVIDAISFASYGTPSGACSAPASGANNFSRGACDAADSASVVAALCVGRASCVVTPTNALFGGDPCDKTRKALAAAVACRGAEALSTYLIDYGQEFNGGVNLTFAGWAGGGNVTVLLGEALANNNTGPGVQSPLKTGNLYASTWSLSASDARANAGVAQHEMIQFRFAEVRGSPVPLTREGARAWVVQHAGANDFERACAASTRGVDAWAARGVAPPPPARAGAGLRWASASAGLDAVLNFTAYTAVASALDVNVDSRTRQRSVCDVDAAITAAAQYAVFAPGDYAYQRKTARLVLDASATGPGMWMEFSLSDVLMAHADARESGSLALARAAWGADDSVTSADGALYTLQWRAGLRYWNATRGMFHFPADCGGGLGASACAPLADWPTTTRDGYVMDTAPGGGNPEDAIRNGFGAIALDALADLAGWLGAPDAAAARYAAAAESTRAALRARQLRWNGSEAFVVDGTAGAAAAHAAVHSTVYAAAAGIADGNATLAAALGAFLARRNVVPSSCMTGRWYVEACFRLGRWAAAPADFALDLLSRDTYPSWGYMLSHQNATMTLEAWAWEDKWNTDAAHPWCASPAFLIPRFVLGAQALTAGWKTWIVAPQPSRLDYISASVPTPFGAASLLLRTAAAAGVGANITLAVTVPEGTMAEACLPLPGDASAQAAFSNSSLWVDGLLAADARAWGRFLCATAQLAPGEHLVERRAVV
jgi:hypothetical protein